MKNLCVFLLLLVSCSPEINSPEWMRGEWKDTQDKGVSYRFDGKLIYVKTPSNPNWKNWVNDVYPFCRVNQSSTDSTYTVQFLDVNKKSNKYFIYKKIGPNAISIRDSAQEEIYNYNGDTIELSAFTNTWQVKLVRK